MESLNRSIMEAVSKASLQHGSGLMHVSPEFTHHAGELLKVVQLGGGLPERLNAHVAVLLHPDASHADKMEIWSQHGNGILSFFKNVANGVINSVPAIVDVVKAGMPLYEAYKKSL